MSGSGPAGRSGQTGRTTRSSASASDAPPHDRSETERAEQAVSEAGERVGRWFATVTARLREEAEDIWADAQAVRHGRRD